MAERLTIGFDLGGTQIRAALVEEGRVLGRAAALTDVAGGPEAVMGQMHALVSQICPEADLERVVAVGMCTPGPLDTETGIVDNIPTLPGWDNFPLRDRLETEFNRPAIVENDAIAAAYGEWKFGAGIGLKHLVYVTVSTGIGGGVVMDGRLLHGRKGLAGHVGHFRITSENVRCSCGTLGCFEAVAAGSALGRRAKAVAENNPFGFLGQKAQTEKINAAHVVEGARSGDAEALTLIKEEAEYLGIGFNGLIHLYSPERVIMGGGVSNAFDLMSEGIHAVIRRDAMLPFKEVPVVRAALGDNAGLVGVASLAVAASRP